MVAVFAIAPYEPDAEGVLRVVLPLYCAFAPEGRPRCNLRIDHHRSRKSGPQYQIAVVVCRCHSPIRYTLYPPGHAPYQRLRIAPVGFTGLPLLAAETPRISWADTVAGCCDPNPEPESIGAPDRGSRTHRRRLDLTSRLLGVHPGQSQQQRERIATRLGIPTMSLLGAANLVARSPAHREQAVRSTLGRVEPRASLLDSVLLAGACAGLWPEPYRWDRPGRLLRSFPRPGTRKADEADERDERTTNPPKRGGSKPTFARPAEPERASRQAPGVAGTPGGPSG